MANAWAILISILVVSGFTAAAWFLSPKGANQTVWRSSLMLTAWCCWLMWVITFLAQLHPLIRPERSDLREAYINFPSGKPELL